ncbi:MAG: hypothetical protein K0R68_3353 [Mycobacterium sp.]|jgi:hypothetical protein|nr:hypothetical protein [Mycobacterium sp.]
MDDVITEDNARDRAMAGFVTLAAGWRADLAANVPAAISFAKALRVHNGMVSFSVRDNGEVWVFSRPEGAVNEPNWVAGLGADVPGALDFVNRQNRGGLGTSFTMRDNGQVWAFCVPHTNPTI